MCTWEADSSGNAVLLTPGRPGPRVQLLGLAFFSPGDLGHLGVSRWVGELSMSIKLITHFAFIDFRTILAIIFVKEACESIVVVGGCLEREEGDV